MSAAPPTCYSRVRDNAREKGLKINEERLREYADILSKRRADLLTKSAFSAEVNKLLADDIERFAAKKRAADAITIATRENAVQSILAKPYGSTVVENMRAFLLGGSLKAGDSVNLDPVKIASAVKSDMLSFWRQGIEKYREIAANGALNREVYQELDAVQRGLPTGGSGSKEALEIAKVVDATLTKIFELKKSYNPFMEKNADYLIKRFHSREKVSAVEKAEWVTDAMRAFGEKSFPDLDAAKKVEVFESVYDRIRDGTFGSLTDDSASDKFITVNGTGGNIMKRMARGRQLQATDWKAAFEYNQKYGFDTIEGTVLKVIDGASKDVSLLEKFGPNPEGMYEGLFKRVYAKASSEEKVELKGAKPDFDRFFQVATGQGNAPARTQIAKWTQGALTVNYLAKTGVAILRSLPDIAVSAGLLRGLNGDTVFENAAKLAGSYMKGFASAEARNEALEGLWMFSRSTLHTMMQDFAGTERAPGALGKMSEAYGKLNLLERHVEAMRSAMGTVVSSELAKVSGTDHATLPETWKKGLLRYGIGEDEWNVLRQGVQDWSAMDSGKSSRQLKLLNADGVDAIPKEFVENYLLKQGVAPENVTPDLLYLTQKKLGYKLGTLINDHADLGSLHAGSRQKAFMFGGRDINDPMGALLRVMWQFKTAALTSLDAYRRMYYSGEGPKGDWSGVAQTMAMSMFMWSIGEYANQAAQGKTPEDPTSPNFVAKAVVGSGAAGIFGDILLGEADRQGVLGVKAGVLANLAGPLIGSAAEGVGIGTQYVKGLAGEGKLPNGALARYLTNLIPGQNLFYARGAFNYYFANGLKEFLDPGYLGHLERNVSQTPGMLEPTQRHWLFSPSESPVWPEALMH